jgi:hypothetical protein
MQTGAKDIMIATPTTRPSKILAQLTPLEKEFSKVRDDIEASDKFTALQKAQAFCKSTTYTEWLNIKSVIDIACGHERFETINTKFKNIQFALNSVYQTVGEAYCLCAQAETPSQKFFILIQSSPTPSPNKASPPPFLDKIKKLTEIAKLAKGDGLVNNGEKITNALDELGVSDPYFQLRLIHQKEHSEKLPEDVNYGKNAIMGKHTGATNHDCLRAIRRSIVALTLKELEGLADGTQQGAIKETLDILEKVPMDSRDLPLDTKNVAHRLFGKLHDDHCKARKSQSSLVDPALPKFGTDFGRHAFFYSADEVDPNTKIQAVKTLFKTLETVWLEEPKRG